MKRWKQKTWRVLVAGVFMLHCTGCIATGKAVQIISNTPEVTDPPLPTPTAAINSPVPTEDSISDFDLMQMDVLAGTYWQGIYTESFLSSEIDGVIRNVLPENGMNYELYLNEDGTASFSVYDRDNTGMNEIDGYWKREETLITVSANEDFQPEGIMDTLYFTYENGELSVSYGGATQIHMRECMDTTRIYEAELKDKLTGSYYAYNEFEEHSVEIMNVIYGNGILMLEAQNQTKDTGEVWSYWTMEFWPDDDALTRTDTTSVTGTMGTFSTMAFPGYSNVQNDVVIQLIEGGFSLTERWNDGSLNTSYYYAADSSYRIHSTAEELAQFLPENCTRPQSLAGTYAGKDPEWETYLALYKDGRAALIQKLLIVPEEEIEEDPRLLWVNGVWAVNTDGNLVLMTERIGGSTQPYTFEIEIQKDDRQLILHTEEYGYFVNGNDRLVLSDAEEDWTFSKRLISQWRPIVSTLLLENGDFETSDGDLMYYYYDLPKINETTAGAESINRKIEDKYLPRVEAALEAMDRNETVGMTSVYSYYTVYDDVYAVIVYELDDISGQYLYDAYYYDAKTGSELSTGEYLAHMKIDEQEFLDRTTEIAVEIFEATYENLTFAQREAAGYDEILNSIGSYIDLTTVKPYVLEYGEVLVACPIASLVGPAYEYHVFMVLGLVVNLQ